MKNTSTKSLGVSEIILALAYLGLSVYSLIMMVSYGAFGTVALITTIMSILSVIVMFIAAVSMLRNTNDKLTVVSVILLGIFQFNIAIGVLFILLLIKRKPGKSESIAKIWFIPIIVQAILTVITLIPVFTNIQAYGYLKVVLYLLPVIHVSILSNWLLRKLKLSESAVNEAKAKQIAYYDDLLQKGAITKEEYDGYIAKIEEDFANGKTTFNNPTRNFSGGATTGNGQKTPAGVLIGIIFGVLVIIWIISDLIWGVGFLHLLFNL